MERYMHELNLRM